MWYKFYAACRGQKIPPSGKRHHKRISDLNQLPQSPITHIVKVRNGLLCWRRWRWRCRTRTRKTNTTTMRSVLGEVVRWRENELEWKQWKGDDWNAIGLGMHNAMKASRDKRFDVDIGYCVLGYTNVRSPASNVAEWLLHLGFYSLGSRRDLAFIRVQ